MKHLALSILLILGLADISLANENCQKNEKFLTVKAPFRFERIGVGRIQDQFLKGAIKEFWFPATNSTTLCIEIGHEILVKKIGDTGWYTATFDKSGKQTLTKDK